MAGPLTRFTLEIDGVRYIAEAPADTSPEDLADAVLKQKDRLPVNAANPKDTPQAQGGDAPDGPPVYEPHVGGIIEGQIVNGDTNIDHYDDDGNYIGAPDPADTNFDPSKGTALPAGIAMEEETRPAVDANLGEADAGNRARAFVTGVLPSFEDELEGMYRTYNKDRPGISVPIPGFPGGGINLGFPWGENYIRERDKVRDDFGLYQQRNPVESGTLEIAGGLAGAMLPGGALMKATRLGRITSPLARTALAGGGAGVVTGAGSADEIEDIPLSALGNGTLGTVISPLAMLGGKTLGGATRWGINKFSPAKMSSAEEAAGDVLHTALRRQDLTPDELATKVAEDRALGIPAMVGDYLVDGADAALRVPNKGRSEHLTELVNRQLNAQERTQSHLNKAFGNPQEYYDTEEKLLETTRSRANDVYSKAYAHGDVRDPLIIGMLQGASMRKFWTRAKDIAELDAEAAVAQGLDPAPYRLKPLFKEVFDDAGNLVRLERTDAVPDVRTLDYIKKGMDDEIHGLYSGSSSAGPQQATGLKKLRNAFVDRVDEIVPDYKAAREVYAGDMEVRDALELGRKINTMVPAQTKKALKKASLAEREAFKTGAYEAFRKMIDDPTTNRNWGKIFSKPGKLRDNLKAIIPPKEYDLIQTVFDREAEIFATSGSRMAGSQTIGRKEAIEDIDRVIQDSDLIGKASAVSTSAGRLKTVIDFLSNRMIDPEKRDRVYTLLSKVYRAGHPDDIMEALELLNATHASSRTASAVSDFASPRLGAAVASAAGKDPAPNRNEEVVSSDFSPVPDTEDDMITEMPATEEGGTATDLPFTIPPTGVPEVDAILPRVLQRESAGDPNAVSPAGAEGLMQVMPKTQDDPGFGVAPVKDDSVAENVRVGSQYLAALYRNYGNDMTLALMAYNWGPDSVDAWLQGGKKIAVPKETKDYVRAILGTEIEE